MPWATNLLHFLLNQLLKKWFLIWHFLFWLLFKKLGNFFQNHLVTLFPVRASAEI